jgi:3-deoxy-D-manno-octulosonate 8-phosphate phosphatase KdsC-like HAD superfamily phosphatase
VIKLLLTDLDGVLTDGYYHINESGEISKSFHTCDFAGLMLVRNAGIQVGILTSAEDHVITEKMKRVKWAGDIHLHVHVNRKRDFVEEYYICCVSGPLFRAPQMPITWEEIAYIGDDVNDMELLSVVGVAACPADADPVVREVVANRKDGFILERNGGKKVVREFCDLVLNINGFKPGVELWRNKNGKR